MECESMLFVKNHIPYLWDLSNSFSNSFIDFYSCEVVSLIDLRKNEVLKHCIKVSVYPKWPSFFGAALRSDSWRKPC